MPDVSVVDRVDAKRFLADGLAMRKRVERCGEVVRRFRTYGIDAHGARQGDAGGVLWAPVGSVLGVRDRGFDYSPIFSGASSGVRENIEALSTSHSYG